MSSTRALQIFCCLVCEGVRNTSRVNGAVSERVLVGKWDRGELELGPKCAVGACAARGGGRLDTGAQREEARRLLPRHDGPHGDGHVRVVHQHRLGDGHVRRQVRAARCGSRPLQLPGQSLRSKKSWSLDLPENSASKWIVAYIETYDQGLGEFGPET